MFYCRACPTCTTKYWEFEIPDLQNHETSKLTLNYVTIYVESVHSRSSNYFDFDAYIWITAAAGRGMQGRFVLQGTVLDIQYTPYLKPVTEWEYGTHSLWQIKIYRVKPNPFLVPGFMYLNEM